MTTSRHAAARARWRAWRQLIGRRRHRWVTRRAERPYPSSGAAFDRFARELEKDGFHSQYGQDRLVAETFFPGVTNGVFVDVGAYDGVTLSNTYHLERRLGWTGIAIEPNPAAFAELARRRSCTTEQVAVGATAGIVTFRAVTGYSAMLSGITDSYDPRHEARLSSELDEHGGSQTEIDVSCVRLDELMDTHRLHHVDYLSIDTEGSELSALESIDFDRHTLSVIGVENNYGDPRIPRFLAARGFRLHSIVGDEFYVPVSGLVARTE